MAITLKDIAERTGVSVATVSRALNKGDTSHTGKATFEKILREAEKIGYVPNIGAQALARGKSGNVVLLLPSLLAKPYIECIEREIEILGLRLIPFASHWSVKRESKVLKSLSGQMSDAIIDLHYLRDNLELYKEMRRNGCNFVFRVVEGDIEDVPFDCVGIDLIRGSNVLVHHLYEQGYRRIGWIGGFAADEIKAANLQNEIVKGFYEGHRANGLEVDPSLAISCEINMISAYESLKREFPDGKLPFDSLIVQSAEKLPGVFKFLYEAGLRPGKDIGVATIGCEHEMICQLYEVTMWAQPTQKLSRGLVSLLKNRLSDQDAPINKIHYKASMIVRSSTCR